MEKASHHLKLISTDSAPAPGGHYAQGVRTDTTLYISGQLPIQPDGTKVCDADFETQARLAIRNVLAVLEAGGGAPSDLAKITAYIVGIENWPRFNAIYADMLGEVRPARSVVPVPELHYGFLVEIDAVASLCNNAAPADRC